MRIHSHIAATGLIGVVLLTGAAPRSFARQQQATSTAADKDDTLKSQVAASLKKNADIAARDIEVLVADGVVTLKGVVRNGAEKTQAAQLATIAGVSAVRNDLRIDADAVKSRAARALEATKRAGQKAAEVTKDTARSAGEKSKEVAGATADKTREIAGTAEDKTKQAAETTADKTKEAAGATADKTKEVAETTADKTKEVAGATADKTKEVAETTADKTREVAAATADKSKEIAEATADKTKEIAKATADKTKEVLSATGEAITDGWITAKVKTKFFDETLLKNSDINVDTDSRVVTLKGTVASMAARTKAEAIAGGTEGVGRVVNLLVVK